MTRYEKLVNRKWNEAKIDDKSLAAKIGISFDEKVKILQRKKMLMPDDEMKNLVKDNVKNLVDKKIKEDGSSLYATKNGVVDSSDSQSLNDIDEMVDKVYERVVSFMPNSDTVEVKKHCQIGGNPDGHTSTPCNQGNVGNLNLKKLK